jgi:hypothetical protein
MEVYMNCYVCGADAQESSFADGCKSVECAGCGRYDISGSVITVKSAGGYRFDAEQMREWFERQRAIYPDRAPFIRDGNQRWAL